MTSYSESILVSGLSFLADRQAGIANNIANVNTSGFKRRLGVAAETPHEFQSLLDEQLPAIGYREQVDFSRGVFRETTNKFDIALDGDFWLKARSASGETFYTRNGELQIDKEGYLVLRDGMRLLGQGGAPIQTLRGDAPPQTLNISPNGTIQDPASGQILGQLELVALEDQTALRPLGKGLYVDPTNQQGKPVAEGVRQGFVEGSNVETLQELVAMMTVQRSFTATQKALRNAASIEQNIINNILR